MSTVSKPVPNLGLMAKLAGQWDAKRKKVVAKRKELHKYMGVGGVRIPAVLTRVYDMAPGNDFSQGFECYLLNVQGAEKEDCTAFIPDCHQGHERIKISIRYNPKVPPPVPESLPVRPTETFLQSRTVRHFSTGDMECLNKLHPGQIIVLNGVSARAFIPKVIDPKQWGVGFDVQAIEPMNGVTLSNLWSSARGMGTDYLMPTEAVFNEQENNRYNRDAVATVSVFSEPTTEEGRAERAERMARENGLTVLEKSGWEAKTWAMEKTEKSPRAMKASLDFLHFQWLTPELAETDSETVMIGMQLWKEQLTEFGITDIDTWVDLAPMIFSKLDFKTIGYVDNKGTASNFGGVAGDKDVDFALQFSCISIIADIAACYERIGVPITADYIRDLQSKVPGCEPSGDAKAAASTEDFLESLSDAVPMTGAAASASVSRKILDLASKDNSGIKFYALICYKMTPNNVRGIASLTPEEGDMLIEALTSNSDAELNPKEDDTAAKTKSKEKVKNLFENISEGESVRTVAFAICRDAIPEDVKSRRNAQLIKFMTGKAPGDARAIEPAPAASASASASASEPAPVATSSAVEELDDDDEGDAEIEDADSATTSSAADPMSRKRDAPEPTEKKRSSKGKGKSKGKASASKKARTSERE